MDSPHRRVALLLLLFLVTLALAQQPPKSDPLPVINPANAKLARSDDKLRSPATSLAFVEAKGLIAIGGEEGKLRAWPRGQDKGLLVEAKMQALPGHEGVITAVAASGSTLVSAGSDGKLRVWNLPADKPAATLDGKATVRGV